MNKAWGGIGHDNPTFAQTSMDHNQKFDEDAIRAPDVVMIKGHQASPQT